MTKLDETLLHDKYFSLMADESTNVSNQSELSLVVRYVAPSPSFEVKVRFLCLELKSTTAESIFTAIDTELKKRKLSYYRLLSCSFDGAANFSGSVSGVRARLSGRKSHKLPYIHCRAHVLSIAATNSRNKHPIIKRTLHVVKDIYKLFHGSSKRENVLHEIQCALEQLF